MEATVFVPGAQIKEVSTQEDVEEEDVEDDIGEVEDQAEDVAVAVLPVAVHPGLRLHKPRDVRYHLSPLILSFTRILDIEFFAIYGYRLNKDVLIRMNRFYHPP